MEHRVVVAEKISPGGLEILRRECEVVDAVGADRAELSGLLGDASGLIVRSATKVDASLISAAPRLRVVGRAGIGVDNIDVAAATAAGVLVVNAPHANTVSAAEHTMALLLALVRRIPGADASMRAGRWDRKSFQGSELYGKTLGLAGLGRIGSLVAQRAGAFGMKVLGFDPYVGSDWALRSGVELVESLDVLVASSDFVSIHVPLTPDTEGLLGADRLALMKPGACIINTSRGGILDEMALAEALRSRQIGGAALDVFADEPLGDSPLRGLDNVILTPHLGAATPEAQDKAGVDVASAVVAALRGELVPSAVNLDIGRDVADEIRPFLPLAERMGRIFVAVASGLPSHLEMSAGGRIGEFPTRPLALAVLKGALMGVSSDEVSYVNASAIAASRGIVVDELVSAEEAGYRSLVRLSGEVGGNQVSLAGTLIERKGPVLVEILDRVIELPITRYLLLVTNQDVPGVIGRVGTYLGERRVNIANMVVGRDASGSAAMMGLNLDDPLSEDQVGAMRRLDGITDARFIDLGDDR